VFQYGFLVVLFWKKAVFTSLMHCQCLLCLASIRYTVRNNEIG